MEEQAQEGQGEPLEQRQNLEEGRSCQVWSLSPQGPCHLPSLTSHPVFLNMPNQWAPGPLHLLSLCLECCPVSSQVDSFISPTPAKSPSHSPALVPSQPLLATKNIKVTSIACPPHSEPLRAGLCLNSWSPSPWRPQRLEESPYLARLGPCWFSFECSFWKVKIADTQLREVQVYSALTCIS